MSGRSASTSGPPAAAREGSRSMPANRIGRVTHHPAVATAISRTRKMLPRIRAILMGLLRSIGTGLPEQDGGACVTVNLRAMTKRDEAIDQLYQLPLEEFTA